MEENNPDSLGQFSKNEGNSFDGTNSNSPTDQHHTEGGNNQENPLFSIVFNIVIPALILSKLNVLIGKIFPDVILKPVWILLIAIAFPVVYFTYDYLTRNKTSFIAILGFVSILLTGLIGVFEFPSEWIAYKEAAVPFIIGIAILISLKTPFPLVRKLLYNKDWVDVDRIDNILEQTRQKEKFDKVLVNSTFMLAASFGVSTILNFTLAKFLIHSPSGTEAFNQELAKMTALSYPVIALPSTLVMLVALYYLIKNVKKITGLQMEEMMAPQIREKLEETEHK